MPDKVGQQIGNYRLIQLLGSGGFADVYLGQHVHVQRLQAAVKIRHTNLPMVYQGEFLQEAETIAGMKHPHIIRILDFGIDRDNAPYLIMEYASHGTLRTRHPKGSIVPPRIVVSYMKQITEALQYAHDHNLIHRDLKPENLLIGENGEIILSDFGIASVAHATTSLETGIYAGTVSYSAPEQIQGKPRPASDQYSVGIMVYEWLSGERPFNGTMTEIISQQLAVAPSPLHEKVPNIPSKVEFVVMTALAKAPQQRFSSVLAFANALEQACLPSFQQPPPAGTLPIPHREKIAPLPPTEPARPQNIPSEPPPSAPKEVGPATGHSGGKVGVVESKDEKVNIWKIGKRQVVAGLIGFAIVVCLSIATGLLRSHSWYIVGLILLVLIVVTPEFFGAVFGPWVGLLTGVGPLVGSIFGYPLDSIRPILLGIILVGFMSGFAIHKKEGRYNIRRTLVFSSLGVVVGMIFAIFVFFLQFGATFFFVDYGLTLSSVFALASVIGGLILLPILLVIYNKIANRGKSTSTTP